MSPTDGRDELRGRFTRWIVITAENAQKNYLRAEKKQLQTVPLEEADVAIVDTALLSAGATPDSFDFEEQRLAEAFRELQLMRRDVYWKCFLSKSLHHLKLQQNSTTLYSMYTTSAPLQ